MFGPALTFKDPALFAGGGPDINDPELWGWWSADYHVTDSSLISVWGDHSANTANKAVGSGRNLYGVGGGTLLPGISTNNNTGNLFHYSESLVVQGIYYWRVSNATIAPNTFVTFDAQNGTLYQTQKAGFYIPSTNYTLTVKLRRMGGAGNTALQLYAGLSTQDILIGDVLAQYTFSFTSPVAGDFDIGIRDTNAAGFGQIEATEWHLREDSWGSTYVSTPTHLKYCGVNGHYAAYFGYYLRTLKNDATDGGITNPCTFYFSIRPMFSSIAGLDNKIISLTGGSIYCFFASYVAGDGMLCYTDIGGPLSVTHATGFANQQWAVGCFVVDGANSVVRINDAETAGTLRNLDANSFINAVAYNAADGGFLPMGTTDIVAYGVAHSLSDRNRYVNWLKGKIGI